MIKTVTTYFSPIHISYEITLLSRISVLKNRLFNMHFMNYSQPWIFSDFDRVFYRIEFTCYKLDLLIFYSKNLTQIFSFQCFHFQKSEPVVSFKFQISDDYSKVFLIQNSLVQCSDKQFPRSENEIFKNLEGWRDGKIVCKFVA